MKALTPDVGPRYPCNHIAAQRDIVSRDTRTALSRDSGTPYRETSVLSRCPANAFLLLLSGELHGLPRTARGDYVPLSQDQDPPRDPYLPACSGVGVSRSRSLQNAWGDDNAASVGRNVGHRLTSEEARAIVLGRGGRARLGTIPG